MTWQSGSKTPGPRVDAVGPRGHEAMDFAVEDIAGGITKIVLRGRFDTTGAVVIELPFNKIVTDKRRVIVDLSDVNFLSSYGIRVLLFGAKIVNGNGGKLAVLCPVSGVAKVLKTAGTDTLIPVSSTEDGAIAAVTRNGRTGL
jgi:anti-sigma B factor antagonist